MHACVQVKGEEASGFLASLGFKPSEVSSSNPCRASCSPELGISTHFRMHACIQMEVRVRPASQVSVVGSYAVRTVAKPELVVDVVVQIPDECLYKKAHLNYR
jgi:hypothetical protein